MFVLWQQIKILKATYIHKMRKGREKNTNKNMERFCIIKDRINVSMWKMIVANIIKILKKYAG